MRQARDTTRWEGAARGNTTAASKGIKLHRWGGTHLLGGHITDYAHHLASRSYRWPTWPTWHPTGTLQASYRWPTWTYYYCIRPLAYYLQYTPRYREQLRQIYLSVSFAPDGQTKISYIDLVNLPEWDETTEVLHKLQYLSGKDKVEANALLIFKRNGKNCIQRGEGGEGEGVECRTESLRMQGRLNNTYRRTTFRQNYI